MTENLTPDAGVRRQALSSGEMQANGIVGPAAQAFRSRDRSLALAVTLAQLIKSKGLGSVGVALTFLEKEPVWAYTAVGFRPVDGSGKLVSGQGDGVLIGVEGATTLEEWLKPVKRAEGTYRTFWVPPVGFLPIWRKLGSYFPEGQWKPEADEIAQRLYTAHREQLLSHWIPLSSEA